MRGRDGLTVDDNLNALHEGFKLDFPALSSRARARLCAHTVFQFHLASQVRAHYSADRVSKQRD
jgi:hypothetical protein